MEIHEYCRVCTKRNTGMKSIFENYKFPECELKVFEVITKCASVQIQQLDGFSSQICKICMELLQQAFRFKQMCEDSDYKLRYNLIKGLKIEAYCDEATKIQSEEAKGSEINEEFNNIFIEVKSEIESDFYEEDANIPYSNLHVERSSTDPTILHNLNASLQESNLPNKTSQISENNINLDCNNEQIKSEINNENEELNDVGVKIKNEFYAEEIVAPELHDENFEEFVEPQNEFSQQTHVCEFCGKCEETILDYGSSVKQPYKCEDCSKNDTCQCGMCDKCLGLKKSLHNYRGEKQKPYKCEFCNRCFTQRNILITHQRVHTGEKPYTCGICNKGFSRRDILNRHRKIHSGEKPYKCETCCKSFSQLSTLRRHNKVHR